MAVGCRLVGGGGTGGNARSSTNLRACWVLVRNCLPPLRKQLREYEAKVGLAQKKHPLNASRRTARTVRGQRGPEVSGSQIVTPVRTQPVSTLRTGTSSLDLQPALRVFTYPVASRPLGVQSRFGLQRAVLTIAGTVQESFGWHQSCPASRTLHFAGGCGCNPRCLRNFSITGRWSVAATIVFALDRRLHGGEIRSAYVASGSIALGRVPTAAGRELQAADDPALCSSPTSAEVRPSDSFRC